MMEKKEFEIMARRVRPRITHEALRIVGDSDEAQDVAQEVLLRMWALRDRLTDWDGCEAVAFTIARHQCISLLRHHHYEIDYRQQALNSSNNNFFSTIGSNPQIELEIAENERWLQQQMEGLPPGQMLIMQMKQGDDMSIAEIARTLDIKEEAVRQQLSKARKKLLERMKERNMI